MSNGQRCHRDSDDGTEPDPCSPGTYTQKHDLKEESDPAGDWKWSSSAPAWVVGNGEHAPDRHKGASSRKPEDDSGHPSNRIRCYENDRYQCSELKKAAQGKVRGISSDWCFVHAWNVHGRILSASLKMNNRDHFQNGTPTASHKNVMNGAPTWLCQ